MNAETSTTLARPKSEALYRATCQRIPGEVNSPVRACKGVLNTPLVVDYGKGDVIVDVDGWEYIDYCGSWGALIHAHAHPLIVEAAAKREALGSTFGIATVSESHMAELLLSSVATVDRIRFVSSGTEATMSAIRLARAFTKREGNHRLVRTRTKQRMKRRLGEAYEDFLNGLIDDTQMDQRLQSYLGILSHANQHTLALGIKNAYWVRIKRPNFQRPRDKNPTQVPRCQLQTA